MDYYEELGVSRTASSEEIRKAYLKLALKLHPDKCGGDKQAFQRVGKIYACLRDPQERAFYDSHGATMKSALDDLSPQEQFEFILKEFSKARFSSAGHNALQLCSERGKHLLPSA